MLDFFAKPFAIAGILAAAGPIIIHLLNRRRFRVVNWAAMDFLREALQRNRKILQMRDLILLVLRVLCVLLVGMALARPFFKTATGENLFQQIWPWVVGSVALGLAIWAVVSSVRITKIAVTIGSLVLFGFAGLGFYDLITSQIAAEEAQTGRHPVHAVLILDNSMSMGYETLEGSLLDQAKAKAAEFIDQLPGESSVSVIPLCGSRNAFSLDAYRSKDDARDALNSIEVVDRRGTATLAIQLAKEACKQVPELPSKRVVFLGDQQVNNWPAESLGAALAGLPELQIVKVSAKSPENVWVSDFQIQDGIADIETPSTFLATVGCTGPNPLKDVQVELTVGGTSVRTQTVDLEPGQSRLLEFKYQIDVPAEPGHPQFVNAAVEVQTATIEGDHLKSDNKRFLVFPVVAGLPVVFVDQLGSREDVRAGEVGETYPLRKYYVPRTSRDETDRELIEVRHITIDQLDQKLLEDARLVFIGGIESPGDKVPLLREYIQQGGQLVILAGGDFDPVQWNEAAWQDGLGILPAPLEPESYGATVEELDLAGKLNELKEFMLDVNTMRHPYFVLEEMNEQELQDFYRLSFFFKAIRADVSPETMADLRTRLTKQLTEKRKFLIEASKRKANWEEMQRNGTFGPEQEAELAQDKAQRERIAPNWLLWNIEGADWQLAKPVEQLVRESLPKVLARFDVVPEGKLSEDSVAQQLPYVIERRIGLGKVLLFTSGTVSDWNTISKTNNMALFDRIPRRLVENTLPERQFGTDEKIVLPIERGQTQQYTLTRPSKMEEVLTVDALETEGVSDSDLYGLTLQNLVQRGIYRIIAKPTVGEEAAPLGTAPSMQLAVNGPKEESDLTLLKREELEERIGSPGEALTWRWIDEGESISLEGAQIRGRDYWKLLVMIVLAGLVLEMLVLAWPAVKQDWLANDGGSSTEQTKEHAA